VPLGLQGVGPDGPVAMVTATSRITSLTITPLVGMKYGQKYQLALDGTIVDLDMPAPSVLTPSTTSFTTFKPPFLGTAGSVASQGIVLFSVRVALSRTKVA
jgi:hypothetical protein